MIERQLLDTHAHLDFAEFDHDRLELLQQMRAQGIHSAIIPAVDQHNWQAVIETAHLIDGYYALGIHPWFVDAAPEAMQSQLQQLAQQIERSIADQRFVAIGEVGLDGLHQTSTSSSISTSASASSTSSTSMPMQQEALAAQIELAIRYQKPLILHAVKAHAPMLALLKREQKAGLLTGVIHGFSGSLEIAKQYIQLGFKLGIGGLILNPNAKKLQQVITQIPTEHLLLETDAPAMAPKGISRHSPLTVLLVLQRLAELKHVEIIHLRKQLIDNSYQCFSLPEPLEK